MKLDSVKFSMITALATIPMEMVLFLKFITPILGGFVWWLIKRYLEKKYN